MAIISGHKGYVRLQGAVGESSKAVLSVGTLFKWRLYLKRQMVEVTPHNVDDQRFRPGHGHAYVELEGYLDDGTSHPNPNTVGVWTMALWPNSDDKQYMVLTGWAEELEWIVSVDAIETFRAKVRADKEPVYYEY